MVPEPLYCAVGPEMTSQSGLVSWNFKFPNLNSNSVFPNGAVKPFWYTKKANSAFPVRVGSAAYAPAGELNEPAPVTAPPPGSNTGKSSQSALPVFPAASVARTQTLYTLGTVNTGVTAVAFTVAWP